MWERPPSADRRAKTRPTGRIPDSSSRMHRSRVHTFVCNQCKTLLLMLVGSRGRLQMAQNTHHVNFN
jgi:hypothetical protein